jgi:hypothetical protein
MYIILIVKAERERERERTAKGIFLRPPINVTNSVKRLP